jgi:hypothetical protein
MSAPVKLTSEPSENVAREALSPEPSMYLVSVSVLITHELTWLPHAVVAVIDASFTAEIVAPRTRMFPLCPIVTVGDCGSDGYNFPESADTNAGAASIPTNASAIAIGVFISM